MGAERAALPTQRRQQQNFGVSTFHISGEIRRGGRAADALCEDQIAVRKEELRFISRQMHFADPITFGGVKRRVGELVQKVLACCAMQTGRNTQKQQRGAHFPQCIPANMRT